MSPLQASLVPAWDVAWKLIAYTRSDGGQNPAELQSLPISLLRPFLPLFENVNLPKPDDFLVGLRAENLLGGRVLSFQEDYTSPIAWVGATLHAPTARLFDGVRAGCWVPGIPRIGPGRELLRRAGFADGGRAAKIYGEFGFSPINENGLYFCFPASDSAAGWERFYLLDAPRRDVHGFAVPASALAGRMAG